MKKILFFSVFTAFLCASVWCDDYFWNGLIDNDWHNYENWDKGSPGTPADPGEYPGSAPGDTAVINSGTVEINSPIGSPLDSLTINPGGTLDLGTHTITADTITNNGKLSLEGSGSQLLAAGTHTNMGGTVEFTGSGTTLCGITHFHNLTITGGNRTGAGNLDVSGNFELDGGSLSAVSLAVTGTGRIGGNITTTGSTQSYGGNVTLGADVTLTGSLVTMGAISGNTHSLTIAGAAEFNGGSGINALSVSGAAEFNAALLNAASVAITGAAAINANITTSGTQHYGAAELGAGGALYTLAGTAVTITGAVTGNGRSLRITGDAVLNAVNALTDLTVTGTAELNAGIITDGSQTYGTADLQNAAITLESTNGNIEAGGITKAGAAGVTITAHAGRIVIGSGGINAGTGNLTLAAGQNITGGGPITSANFTASASGGITLANAGNSVTSVTFTNTGTGDISYTNARAGGLTVTNAVNSAGKVTITELAGNLTIGTITSNTLALIADGRTVAIGNAANVTINDSNTVSGHIGNASVYIKADALNVTGSINFSNLSDAAVIEGRVCLYIDNIFVYSGDHHIHNEKHIVYSSEPDPAGGYDGLNPGDYIFYDASLITASEYSLYTPGSANIYLINVDDSSGSENASSRILNLTTESAGRVEIRGYYKTISGGELNIVSTGGVRLNNANVTLSGDFNTSGAPLTVTGTAASVVTADNITAGGGIGVSGPPVNLTLTASSIHITGTAGTPPGSLGALEINGNLTLENTVLAASLYIFSGPVSVKDTVALTGGEVALAGNLTFSALSGGTLKIAEVKNNSHRLTFGGGSESSPFIIGHTVNPSVAISGGVTIAANSHIRLDANTEVEQAGAQTLELESKAVLDTSAGSWHMGTGSSNDDFSGDNGTLLLHDESNLIGNNVNLTEPNLKVNNTDWAAISAKGDVEIGTNTASFTGNFPRLIIKMDGNSGQTLTTSQILGSLHIGERSRTELVVSPPLTDTVFFSGEVKIFAGSSNWLDAGNYDIVMYAKLSGTRNLTGYLHIGVNPVKYARWEIVNASIVQPPFSSPPNMNNFVFRQNSGRKVSFQRDPADSSTPVFFEIAGNTMWREIECTVPGAVMQFSRHPDQHTVLEKFSIGNLSSSAADHSDYVTITRLTESRNIDGIGVDYGANYPYLYVSSMGQPPMTPDAGGSASVGTLGNFALPVYFPPMDLKITGQAEQGKYWNINLISSPGQMPLQNFRYVRIFFSHAYNQRIPIETSSMHLDAVPYYRESPREGYFNFDWIELRKILYSFTEDSSGNGRLDRIRVQTNVALNGDFSGFDARVEGYEIDRGKGTGGFELVSGGTGNTDFDNDSFYIYLKENPGIDSGNTPLWSVTRNRSLMDALTESSSVGDPSLDRNIKPFDTIPPRVAYSLTLPGYPQTYVRMSEPVVSSSNAAVFESFDPGAEYLNGARAVDTTRAYTFTWQYFPFDGSPVNYSLGVPSAALGYLLNLQDTFGIKDLAELNYIYGDMSSSPGGGYFRIDDMVDQGQRAMDWHDPLVDPAFYIYYQPPKYPLNWGYTEYAKVLGNSHLSGRGLSADDSDAVKADGSFVPLSDVFLPPNKLLTVEMMTLLADGDGENITPQSFASYSDPLDPDSVIRRITDVLVSIPPDGANSGNYFAWPVWARFSEPLNADEYISPPAGIFWGQQNTDTGIIWEFDGTGNLEPRFLDAVNSINLQARINNEFLSSDLRIFWTTADVPSNYRNPADSGMDRRTGGLWLPEWLPLLLPDPDYLLHYYVSPVSGIKNKNDPSPSSPLFNFTFSLSELDLETNGSRSFEFVFNIDENSDLFIARLEAPRGVIPNNWYTLVRPFSFNIQNIRLQRGGVTVLNNVINSDARETAFIRYNLARPGRVTIQIYTLDGTLVKSVRRNEYREAGEWTDAWDGTNNSGRAVARGMYFVRVVGPDIDEIRKIMVVR